MICCQIRFEVKRNTVGSVLSEVFFISFSSVSSVSKNICENVSSLIGVQTKRPATERPATKCPWEKTFGGTKHRGGQNVRRDKTIVKTLV